MSEQLNVLSEEEAVVGYIHLQKNVRHQLDCTMGAVLGLCSMASWVRIFLKSKNTYPNETFDLMQ